MPRWFSTLDFSALSLSVFSQRLSPSGMSRFLAITLISLSISRIRTRTASHIHIVRRPYTHVQRRYPPSTPPQVHTDTHTGTHTDTHGYTHTCVGKTRGSSSVSPAIMCAESKVRVRLSIYKSSRDTRHRSAIILSSRSTPLTECTRLASCRTRALHTSPSRVAAATIRQRGARPRRTSDDSPRPQFTRVTDSAVRCRVSDVTSSSLRPSSPPRGEGASLHSSSSLFDFSLERE
jgi:hypothetical protein